MVHIHRIAVWLLLAFLCGSSFAEEIQATATVRPSHKMYLEPSAPAKYWDSGSDACVSYGTRSYTTMNGFYLKTDATVGNIAQCAPSGGSGIPYPTWSFGIYVVNACAVSGTLGPSCTEYTCPANQGWTLNGTICSRPDCPYGRDPVTLQCNTCPDGQKMLSTVTDTGSFQSCGVKSNCSEFAGKVIAVLEKENASAGFATSYDCVNGCTAKTTFDMGMKYTNSAGVEIDVGLGNTVGLGGQCDTNTADGSTAQKPAPVDKPTNPNSKSVSDCPLGQYKQTVNGVEVCAAPGAGDTTTSEKTTTSTDAAGNTTTTKTTTTCTGSNCTTTTTATPAANPASATTTSQTEDKLDLCKANPGLSICKIGTFSGNCGSVPACDGDAVLCAVARATFETNCAFDMPDAVTGEETAYGVAKTKTGDQTTGLSGNSSVTVSSSSIDKTEALGAGAGMQDVTVTVAGQSVSIPFSNVNPWLSNLGNILVAISGLVSALILAGVRNSGG